MGIEVAIAAAVVAVAGTVAQGVEARKQGKQQEKIAGQQGAVEKAEQIQNRRTAVRKARLARARIEQAGENTGTGGSSIEAGVLGGTATQLAQQRSDVRTSASASRGIQRAGKRIGESQLRGTIFQGITDIASTVFAASVGGAGSPDPGPPNPPEPPPFPK